MLDAQISSQRLRHRFLVLKQLETPVIIGVDLWARTRLRLAPPMIGGHSVGMPNGVPGLATAAEEKTLKEFLRDELAKFKGVRGPIDRAEHCIKLTNPNPIKQWYRPRNPAMQKIIDEEMGKMLEEGIIEPSASAWSSPVVLVKKRDNTRRFCIDFRQLNEVTIKDAYPLPHVYATLDKLRDAQYLSTLDLKSGYWQIPLSKESRPLTAFAVPGRGLMQFRVMPFGLHSAATTFQRLIDNMLGPELEPNVLVYLDDIIIVSQTFSEHLAQLKELFQRLRAAHLKINIEKCKFCVPQLRYLGHLVDRNGIHTDPEKVRAMQECHKSVQDCHKTSGKYEGLLA